MNQQYVLWLMAKERQADIRKEADIERRLHRAEIEPNVSKAGTLLAAVGAVTLAVLLAAERAAASFGGAGGGGGPVPFM